MIKKSDWDYTVILTQAPDAPFLLKFQSIDVKRCENTHGSIVVHFRGWRCIAKDPLFDLNAQKCCMLALGLYAHSYGVPDCELESRCEVPSRNGCGNCRLYDILAQCAINDYRCVVMALVSPESIKALPFSGIIPLP